MKLGCTSTKKEAISKLPDLDFSVLPPLSSELKAIVEQKGAEEVDTKLISFYGQYLLQKTDGTPSRYHYGTLSSSIVSAFPALKGGSNGHVKHILQSIYI